MVTTLISGALITSNKWKYMVEHKVSLATMCVGRAVVIWKEGQLDIRWVWNCLCFWHRFYRGSHGVIVVYDVSRIDSFANVKRWLQEIDQNCDAKVQKVLGLYHLHSAYSLLFHVNHCRLYHYYNRFTALCPGLPGWAGNGRNFRSHLSWSSIILYLLFPSTTIRSILCSIYMLDSLSAQPFSKSSLVYLLV